MSSEFTKTGCAGNPLSYAPTILQDSAYPFRMWITLNKLLYAPLQYHHTGPGIHEAE
jgi:hypothetical protein